MSNSKINETQLKSTVKSIFEGIFNVQELEVGSVVIPSSYIKDSLNPKIWNGEVLNADIREHLLKIAKAYIDYLDIDAKPEQILFLGSMANYNWNESSDLDLHLLYDLNKLSKDVKLAKDFFDAKGSNWKSNHDITLKGYNVELYVQEKNEKNNSVGVYDLVKNEWVNKPEKENVTVDKELIKKKASAVATKIEDLENRSKENSDWSEIQKESKTLKEKIKKMRQSGLDKSGEFSAENLAFKYLRNNGYLERLGNIASESFDKNLSLNEEKMDTNKKHRLVIKKSVDNLDENKISLIKKFIIACCEELKIEEPCYVFLTGERGGPITTTASYNPGNDHIWIYTKNRNMLADPLRSLAHEIRHYRQKLDGVLTETSGEDGSPHENEANSFSGLMIRKFGKKHREIYE